MRVDFDIEGYDVVVNVNAVRDAFGTGDSPTEYDVDIVRIRNAAGELTSEQDIEEWVYEAICDEAISIYKGE